MRNFWKVVVPLLVLVGLVYATAISYVVIRMFSKYPGPSAGPADAPAAVELQGDLLAGAKTWLSSHAPDPSYRIVEHLVVAPTVWFKLRVGPALMVVNVTRDDDGSWRGTDYPYWPRRSGDGRILFEPIGG